MSKSLGRPLRLSHADIVCGGTATAGDRDLPRVDGRPVGSDGYGRLAVNNQKDGSRMLTPHQVAAPSGFGRIPEGATLLRHCEVRLCCRYDPHRHVTVGPGRDMRQAVARGRAVGPAPAGSTCAARSGRSTRSRPTCGTPWTAPPSRWARVLAKVIADGDPLRDLHQMFDT